MGSMPGDSDILSELIPFRCPKCGNARRFPTLRELKVHLQTDHTFKTYTGTPARPQRRLFDKESDTEKSILSSIEKEKKNNTNYGRSSPLLQSFKDEANLLEHEVLTAKQDEMKHKTKGLKYLSGTIGQRDVKDTLLNLNKEVMHSRDNQWKTADALYKSQDTLQNLEVAAEARCSEQREIIKQLITGMKNNELSPVNREHGDDLRRERERLVRETEDLLKESDENNSRLKEELQHRGRSISSLTSELEQLRSRFDREAVSRDMEVGQANENIQRLAEQREHLVRETDTLLKVADRDKDQLKTTLKDKEDQLGHVTSELDKMRWEQQRTLEQCIELYRKADEGSNLLKNLVQNKDAQLTEALDQLNRMREVQSRLLEESEVLTGQADDNSLAMKRLLARKEEQLGETQEELHQLKRDQDRLRQSTSSLAGRAEESSSVIQQLQQLVQRKENELERSRREFRSLQTFIQKAADKERSARGKLEAFIGELINRADKAETELQMLKSQSSSSTNWVEADTPSVTNRKQNGGTGNDVTHANGLERPNQHVRQVIEEASDLLQRYKDENSDVAQTFVVAADVHESRTEPDIKHSQPGKVSHNIRSVHTQRENSQPTGSHIRTHHTDTTGETFQGAQMKSPVRKKYRQGSKLAPQILNLGMEPWHQQLPEGRNADAHTDRPCEQSHHHARHTVAQEGDYDDGESEFLTSYMSIDKSVPITRTMPIPKVAVPATRTAEAMHSQAGVAYADTASLNHQPSNVYNHISTRHRPNPNRTTGVEPIKRYTSNPNEPRDQQLNPETGRPVINPANFNRMPVPPSITNPVFAPRRPPPHGARVGRSGYEINRFEHGIDGKLSSVSNVAASRPRHEGMHVHDRTNPTHITYPAAEIMFDPRFEPLAQRDVHEYNANNLAFPRRYVEHSNILQPHMDRRMYQARHSAVYGSIPNLYYNGLDPRHAQVDDNGYRYMGSAPRQSRPVRERRHGQRYAPRSRSLPPRTRHHRTEGYEFDTAPHGQDEETDGLYPISREVRHGSRDLRALSGSPVHIVRPNRRSHRDQPRSSYRKDHSTHDRTDMPQSQNDDKEVDELEDGNFDRIMDANGILWDDMDTLPDVSDSEFDRVSPSGSEAAEPPVTNVPLSVGGAMSSSNNDRTSAHDNRSKRGRSKEKSILNTGCVDTKGRRTRIQDDHQLSLSDNRATREKSRQKGNNSSRVANNGKSSTRYSRRGRSNDDLSADDGHEDFEETVDRYKHGSRGLESDVPTIRTRSSQKERPSRISSRSQIHSSTASRNDEDSSMSRSFRPIRSPVTRKSSPSERDMTSGGREINSVLHRVKDNVDGYRQDAGRLGSRQSGNGRSRSSKQSSGPSQYKSDRDKSDATQVHEDTDLGFDDKLKSIAAKYSAKRKELVDTKYRGDQSCESDELEEDISYNFTFDSKLQSVRKDTTQSYHSQHSPVSGLSSKHTPINSETDKNWMKYSDRHMHTNRHTYNTSRSPVGVVFDTVTSRPSTSLGVRRCSENNVRQDPPQVPSPNNSHKTMLEPSSPNYHTVTADVHPLPKSQTVIDEASSSAFPAHSQHSQRIHSPNGVSNSSGNNNMGPNLTSERKAPLINTKSNIQSPVQDPDHTDRPHVSMAKDVDSSQRSLSVSENFSMFAEPIDDHMSGDGDSNTQSALDQSIQTETDHETDTESSRRGKSPRLSDDLWNTRQIYNRNVMSPASSQASFEMLDRVPVSRREEVRRRRHALSVIFSYLDTWTLGRAAQVCREWRIVSRNPRLWTRVDLRDANISVKFLTNLARRCSKLTCLILDEVRPRKRRHSETLEDYIENTSCCLEPGLEQILKKSEATLTTVSISNCAHALSAKCLWEASCYSRMLRHVTYISDVFPVGPEVMWALGSSCRDLVTLIVHPLYPCQKPDVFSTKCVQMVAKCFSDLESLSVGGIRIDLTAMTSIAQHCRKLVSLELNHMTLVTMATAVAMSDTGLATLQFLRFISTPVETGAVQVLYDSCKQLREIRVQVSRSDFIQGTKHLEVHRDYQEELDRLKTLLKKPGIGSILKIQNVSTNLPSA